MKTREELAQIWVAERIQMIMAEPNFPGKARVLSEYTMTQVIVGKELLQPPLPSHTTNTKENKNDSL